jgi:hypothetical protein
MFTEIPLEDDRTISRGILIKRCARSAISSEKHETLKVVYQSIPRGPDAELARQRDVRFLSQRDPPPFQFVGFV